MALTPEEKRRRRRATQAAKRGGYTDKNFDGVPDRDELDLSLLSEDYAVIAPLFTADADIARITQQAQREGWFESPAGKRRYQMEIQNTPFWQNNNRFAREAWASYQQSKSGTSADWRDRVTQARAAVQQRAAQKGAALDQATLDRLANDAIWGGWLQEGRINLLDDALAERIAPQPAVSGEGAARLRGEAGTFALTLREAAQRNGLSYSNGWYQSAAQSVARGLTTEEDWIGDIREQAASRWPVFADKIRSGFDARDLASPYITLMAQELELNPSEINLDDPYIAGALGGFSKDGTPSAENLWDFQKRVRNDPRWMNTRKAQNEVTSVTGRVMQMFGLMGG